MARNKAQFHSRCSRLRELPQGSQAEDPRRTRQAVCGVAYAPKVRLVPDSPLAGWREMDSNHRSLAKSRGSRQVDILQILAGRPSGYPTVGHCGDVRFRALVKGSMAWLLCLPVGQASSLASSCCSTLFCSLGLRQVFRRGTNGSNPVSSSGESICEPHFLPFNRLRWTCKQRATIGRSAAEATAARFSEMTSLTSRSLAVQPGRVNFSLLLLRAFSADWPPRWRRGRGA
jgi:hypothetical protein